MTVRLSPGGAAPDFTLPDAHGEPVALAGLRWREHLAWVVMEGFHFVFVWMHIGRGSNDRVGMPEDGYAAVVAARLAVWVVLIALFAVRSSRGERLQ